ncbi:porin [Sphaerotilus sp.]|uniref:porin n=1 Tax=Sphaerotilus sp. TaxID=2093942 RepID=UPI00286DA54E|nr:porin [Sphaerotilus sp.]
MTTKTSRALPLAACLLWALTGSAAAQSTVTLYGVVDTNVTYGHGSLRTEKAVGTGGLAGSRLGFRGTEDLGGGLRANFAFEHGFNSDIGTATAVFWNRQSLIGLASPAGEVQLGRLYTPTFMVHATYDAFGPQGVAAQQVLLSSLEVSQAANIRANNAVQYQTPATLGGFVAQLMTTDSDGTPGKYTGARFGYAGGALAADVAFGNYDNNPIGDLKTLTVGARYKVGALAVFGLYDRARSGLASRTQGLQMSMSWTMGSTELKASVAQSSVQSAAGADIGTTRRIGVGAVHNLSRRTALYTSMARVTNSNGASTALNGSATAVNQGSHGIDVGIRHAF